MKIISVDPGKFNTGVFFAEENMKLSWTCKYKMKNSMEEILSGLYKYFCEVFFVHKYDLGLIEGSSFNIKNLKSIVPLAEVRGVIKLVFALHGVPLIDMPVQTWKSLTIGKIDKKKESKYLAAIEKKYGIFFRNTHEADAFLIYRAAKIIMKKNNKFTLAERKIREQIMNIMNKYENGDLSEKKGGCKYDAIRYRTDL